MVADIGKCMIRDEITIILGAVDITSYTCFNWPRYVPMIDGECKGRRDKYESVCKVVKACIPCCKCVYAATWTTDEARKKDRLLQCTKEFMMNRNVRKDIETVVQAPSAPLNFERCIDVQTTPNASSRFRCTLYNTAALQRFDLRPR